MNSVLLVNREMTIVHAPCLVQGINGENIGVSKFSPKHSCHILELTPEAYEKHAKVLMQACHIALRRWEPHFVFEPLPKKVQEYWDGYNDGLDGKTHAEGEPIARQIGYTHGFLELPEPERKDVINRAYGEETMEALASAPMKESAASSLIESPEEAAKFMDGVAWSKETIPLDKVIAFFKDTLRIGPAITAETMKAADEKAAGKSIIFCTLPAITERTKYWSLIKAAREEGVDITKCGTNAERAKAINEHRCQPH